MRYYGLELFSLLFLLCIVGCSSSNKSTISTNPGPQGSVAVSLEYRDGLSGIHGSIKGAIDPSAFGVSTIRVLVTAASAEIISKDFPYIAGGRGTLTSVPEGSASVLVSALDSGGTVIFSGSTNVVVVADQTTVVESLVLFSESSQDAPLTLGEISVANIQSTSARIDFLTNRVTTAEVRYGLVSSELTGVLQSSTTAVTNHRLLLPDLQNEKLYFFKVFVTDSTGSKVESSLNSFTTGATGAMSAFSILINNGATHTNKESVTLTLTASSKTKKVKIVEGSDLSGAVVQTFATSLPLTLSSGEALKTVTILFLDETDSPLSQLSGSITLDKTAPTFVSLGSSGVNVGGATLIGEASEKVFWSITMGNTTQMIDFKKTDTVAALTGTVSNSDFGTLGANTTYYFQVTITDLAGNVTVSQVMSFNTTGTVLNNSFVMKFGNSIVNSDDGSLRQPTCLTVHNGNIYVFTDVNTNKIQVFDANGNFLYSAAPFFPTGGVTVNATIDNFLFCDSAGTFHEVGINNPTASRTLTSFDAGTGYREVREASASNYLALYNGNVGTAQLLNFDKITLGSISTFTSPYSFPLTSFDYLGGNNIAWTQYSEAAPAFFKDAVSNFGVATSLATQTIGATQPGFFNGPAGVVSSADASKIYVCDKLSDRVQVFSTPPGSFTETIGQSGAGSVIGAVVNLLDPADIELDTGGRLHILDKSNSRIAIVDPATGLAQGYYGNASPSYHTIEFSDVELANNQMYLCRPSDGGSFNGMISVFDTAGVHKWQMALSHTPQTPYRIEHVPGSSTLFILRGNPGSEYLDRMSEVSTTPNATLLDSTPVMTGYISDLTYVPATNEVWITASATGHIHRFKAGALTYNTAPYGIGTNLGFGGAAPQPDGQFTHAAGIDNDNTNLYICDYGNKRIQVWNAASGVWSKSYALTFEPYRVSYANGRLYVTSDVGDMVYVISASDGSQLATVGSFGTTDGLFHFPYAIFADSTHFWVIDATARVQQFLQ